CSSFWRPIPARSRTCPAGRRSAATSCSRRTNQPPGRSATSSGRRDRMATEMTELLDQAVRSDDGSNKENKITIIAWGGDLDRIWPTLILSTTAAASGMQASVFFTFWGLFTLVKPGVRITGENWMQKMLSVMNPGSPGRAKLSKLSFAGAGGGMMKKLAKDYKVPEPQELLALAQERG